MTTIPSPDEALLNLSDRLAAIPQRRGVPLPLVTMPVGFVHPAGCALVGASLMALVGLPPMQMMGGLFVTVSLTDLVPRILGARRRLRDARAWSPEIAARYRSEALAARATGAVFRILYGAITTMAIVMTAMAFGRSMAPQVVALSVGFILWTGGHFANCYADCVMPVDPDLRSPAAVPQAT